MTERPSTTERPPLHPSRPHARDERGFTLLEMAVAGVIVALVLGLLASVLISSLQASAEVSVTTGGSQSAERAADEVARHVLTGTRFTVLVANTDLDVQEPVDHDGDGDFFDEVGDIEYGALGNLGWKYQYCWTANGTISESANGLDINRDGDLIDTFQTGTLLQRIYDQNGAQQQVRPVAGGDLVLQPLDGETDAAVPPIYSIPYENGCEIAITTLRTQQVGRSRVPRLFVARRVVTQR